MKQFDPDKSTQITYDENVKAFYIKLHYNNRNLITTPWTETLNEEPLINVDRIGDTVIGIEIIP